MVASFPERNTRRRRWRRTRIEGATAEKKLSFPFLLYKALSHRKGMVKVIIIKGMADPKVTFVVCEKPTPARKITEVRSSSLSSMNSRIKNPSPVSSNEKTAR